ncbi:MAG: hypothetical protein K8S25_06635 [Alphaproteobacteria bacterium]|nr:hypothetical protein [Alphaproteobacteria bacterium]
MLFLITAAAITAANPIDVAPTQELIATACGAKVLIEIDRRSFGNDEDAMTGLQDPGIAFLGGAFADLCKDADRKADVVKQISKVVIAQANGAADPIIYLTRKTLHLEYFWTKGQPGPDQSFVRDEIASRLRGEEAEAP